jgi:cytochrome c-type biogenesis protein CcmH/NrfG
MLAAVTPTTHRDSVPTGRGASRPISTPLATAGRRASSGTTLPTNAPVFTDASGLGGLKKIAIVAVGLVAFAAVAYGIYQFGNTNAPSIASASPTPAASAGLDQAKVAALMAKYQANPNDTATLLALGNAFFAAQDYTSAAGWLDKVVALEPNNVQALLALGAAKFNLGDDAAAKTDWLKVVSLDAKNVEAHYDLGFLYFNATPQDVEGVRREWGQVVTLSPGSDVARVVQAHLDALTAQSSGAPSAAPSGGVSPAPSAAPSASGSPGPS